MADIMTSIGLDINDFKGAVNQLQESTAKLKTGVQGNMLAMAAGILGVGATVYTFAKQSAEDFDNLISRSKKLSEEFKNLASDAGFATLNSTMSKTVALSEELAVQEAKSAAARDNILKGYAAGISALSKGKGLGDIELETQMEISRLYWQKVKLMQDVTAQSDLDVKMSELKLKGADDEVEALKRKAKLEKEIAEIIKSSFDARTKATLIQNAEQIAANEEELAADKKQAKQEEHNRKQKEDFLKFQADEQKKMDEAQSKQEDHDRKQKEDFLKFESDKQKEIADKAKKEGDDALAANREMQAAEQALIDKENEKLSLKTQAQLQSKKVADAEFNLSKAANGTAEFYERQAELARERLKLENLLSARAKAYEKGQLSGRRFDREQEKARKKEEQGRARLGRQIARENKQPVPQRPAGVGGPIAPRPMMQPQAAQPAAAGVNGKAAGNVMTVETLNVKVLKSQ